MIHIHTVVWAQCNIAGHAFSLQVIYFCLLKCQVLELLLPEPFILLVLVMVPPPANTFDDLIYQIIGC